MPEFLNRIDETIIFHPLGRRELTQIVDIQLGRLERQLAEAGLSLRVSEAAEARLAEEGFEPAFGARPLKRVIQQRLANPLANALLEERIRKATSSRSTMPDPSSHSIPRAGHGEEVNQALIADIQWRRPGDLRSVRRAGSGPTNRSVRRAGWESPTSGEEGGVRDPPRQWPVTVQSWAARRWPFL